MNRMIWPSASWTSFSTAFSRSSNSPRYLEPATSAPTSSAITRRSRSDSGNVAVDDPLGEALDDRRLADPGLADQHRVVLRPARQHLDHPADLLVAPDHRVEPLPLRASAVRSRPNFSSASAISSAFGEVTRLGPCVSATARASDSRSGSRSATSGRLVGEREQQMTRPRCTRRRAQPSRVSARWRTLEEALRRGRPRPRSSPLTVGSGCDRGAGALGDRGDVGGELAKRRGREPWSCSSRATSRCSGTTSGLRFWVGQVLRAPRPPLGT